MHPWQNPFVRVALVTVAVLLVPLIAMRFTDAVAWNLADFLVAGALVFSAGAAFVLLARKAGRPGYRVAVGLAVGTGLVLTWMNLAVGLLGSEDKPANLLYGGVFVIGVVGALLARFRPAGMARAMATTAVALLLVPLAALVIFRPPVGTGDEIAGELGVIGSNVFFALLLVASAVLFRRAAGAGQER